MTTCEQGTRGFVREGFEFFSLCFLDSARNNEKEVGGYNAEVT